MHYVNHKHCITLKTWSSSKRSIPLRWEFRNRRRSCGKWIATTRKERVCNSDPLRCNSAAPTRLRYGLRCWDIWTTRWTFAYTSLATRCSAPSAILRRHWKSRTAFLSDRNRKNIIDAKEWIFRNRNNVTFSHYFTLIKISVYAMCYVKMIICR